MQLIYLAALAVYVPIWIYMYIRGSFQNRKEMWFMSIFIAILSPISSYLWWNRDWWVPPSILNGYIVIPEDIVLGFLFGGVSAVIYEIVFHKKIKRGAIPHMKSFWFLSFLLFLICGSLFSIFKLNSFNSVIISIAFVLAGVLYIRRDLIKSSLFSGVLTLLICIPFYAVIHFLSPEWALVTYKYEFLSGFTVFNFPIEEFLFWFFYGLIIGPAYEYIKGWSFK